MSPPIDMFRRYDTCWTGGADVTSEKVVGLERVSMYVDNHDETEPHDGLSNGQKAYIGDHKSPPYPDNDEVAE